MALDFGKTSNFLLRWLRGDNAISDIDEGFRALAEDVDQKMMGFVEDTAAKRPFAGIPNRIFRASDTHVVELDDGKEWKRLTVGNGLFSNFGGVKVPLELRMFQSAPSAGQTALFSYTESGIAFPTACIVTWVGGFLNFSDAGHTSPVATSLNIEVVPRGKNVEVAFQQPAPGEMHPVINLFALGY